MFLQTRKALLIKIDAQQTALSLRQRLSHCSTGVLNDLVMYSFFQSTVLAVVIAFMIRAADEATHLSRLRLVSDLRIWTHVVFFLVTHDLWQYWFHRLQHRHRRLWSSPPSSCWALRRKCRSSKFSVWEWLWATAYLPQQCDAGNYGLHHSAQLPYGNSWKQFTFAFRSFVQKAQLQPPMQCASSAR